MIIIDKNKRAPIFKQEPLPSMNTTLERQRYYEREKTRWIEGYGSLPGTFYFACTQGHYKDRVSGKIGRYQARESGLILHEFIREQMNKKRMGGVIKPRGVGFSTEGGILANYFMRVHPGTTSIVTAKDQSSIQTIFKEKVMPCYEELPAEIRPDIVNKNDTKQMCYLRVQVETKDDTGKTIYPQSEVFLRETSESAKSVTNLSGKGAKFGLYDEFPLHPRPKELIESSIECFKNPTTKELDGFLLWGGTVEAALSGTQLAKFRKMVNDSSVWDCDILFMPFELQMYLDENGYCDRERAYEWWNRTYEKLLKANDDGAAAKAHLRNNPRSLEDIFESSDGSRWEDDVSEILKRQRREVINLNPVRSSGIITEIKGNLEFSPMKNGHTTILEQPKPGVLYYEVIDGVATGSETSVNTGVESNVAGLIVKGFDPDGDSYKPVAMYFERPKNVEQSYINLVNMAKYFNRYGGLTKINAEANASTADHFSTFLAKNGMSEFIVYRKSLNGTRNSTMKKNIPFFYVNNDVRDYQMKQANSFLRRHAGSITLIELLDQMMTSVEENADVLDAWLMLFLTLPPDFDASPKEKVTKKRMVRVMVRNNRGELVYEWKTV